MLPFAGFMLCKSCGETDCNWHCDPSDCARIDAGFSDAPMEFFCNMGFFGGRPRGFDAAFVVDCCSVTARSNAAAGRLPGGYALSAPFDAMAAG